MELKALVEALAASCEGKVGGDEVKVDARLLLAAQQELKDKVQMARDLEMARDEASMKPSVARKLNERIRGLEAELEELRSNKKVKELEKKVQFLEHELKQSYTTKNFTLKSGLMQLEKQYRAEMNVNQAMSDFWDDIVVLLDEKKERDGTPLQPKGPRGTSAAATDGAARTPRSSTTDSHPPASTATPAAAAAAPAAAEAAAVAAAGQDAGPQDAAAAAAAGAAGAGLIRSSSTAVSSQVEVFNTIISEEMASAATAMPADASHADKEVPGGQMVVRHGAGFRIVKGAAAAAADGDAAAAAGGGGTVLEQQQQPVQLLARDLASRLHDVSFHALPAHVGRRGPAASSGATAGAAAAAGQPAASAAAAADVAPATQGLQQQADAVADSIRAVMALCGSMAGGGSLPRPPVLQGGAGEQQQQQEKQQHSGQVDSSSLWQLQLERVLASVQQLKQAGDGSGRQGPASLEDVKQQQDETAALLAYIGQLRGSLQGSGSSSKEAAEVLAQLVALQAELQQLQHLQQRALAEAGGQDVLLAVFGEFVGQLEQQGVLAGGAAGAAGSGQAGDAQQQQQQQQAPLLQLLRSFLDANPNIPALLAAQLAAPTRADAAAAAAAAAGGAGGGGPPELRADSSSSGVQAVADSAHQGVQTAPPPAAHAEVQAVSDSEHREVQCTRGAEDAQHAATQYDPAATPQSHAAVQVEPPPPPPLGHASIQTDAAAPPPVAHASTQAAAQGVAAGTQAAAEGVAAATQVDPAPVPVSTQVQADLRPEISHASSQADLGLDLEQQQQQEEQEQQQQPAAEPAAAAAAAAAQAPPPLAKQRHAGAAKPSAAADTDAEGDDGEEGGGVRRSGSGITYAASGSELSVGKVAVGQQLDLLDSLSRNKQQRSEGGSGSGGSGGGGRTSEGLDAAAAALVDVRAEDLQDLGMVAKELSQLRSDNLELAANLQVNQSLVEHLNTNLKSAIDKADDAEAEAVQIKEQLDTTAASLAQLQAEHAELTHELIDAKVVIAEKNGELLKLVRDLKRAIRNPVSQNAAGVVKELENILAVVPSGAAEDDPEVPASPARDAASRAASNFATGLAAGLGQVRDYALGGLGAASRGRSRLSDSTTSSTAAAAATAGAAAPGSSGSLARSESGGVAAPPAAAATAATAATDAAAAAGGDAKPSS